MNDLTRIPSLMADLDRRHDELVNKERAIDNAETHRNEVFDSLMRGYCFLGYIKDELKQFDPISRQDFPSAYDTLSSNHQSKIKHLFAQGDSRQIKNELENHIAELIDLFGRRWNTILEFKKIWRDRRMTYREQQLELMSELEALASQISSAPDDWNTNAGNVLSKQLDLMDEQGKLLSAEEDLHEELDQLFEMREDLLKQAVALLEGS